MPTDGIDPKIVNALKKASGTIPVEPGEKLRIEFVVTATNEVRISLPAAPQMEGEVWKFLAYAPDFVKQYYQKKVSPLSL